MHSLQALYTGTNADHGTDDSTIAIKISVRVLVAKAFSRLNFSTARLIFSAVTGFFVCYQRLVTALLRR